MPQIPSAPPAAASPKPPAVVFPAWPALSATDRDVLIRTVYGEARGETAAGQVAVVHVIRNRAIARKSSAAIECQRRSQFSCWNAGDPNRALILALAAAGGSYQALGKLVDAAWAAPDTVAGARHYYAASMKTPPAWAATGRLVARIGGHLFFAGVA